MKTVKLLFTVIMLLAITAVVTAQTSNKTAGATATTKTFRVSGNCDMCKTRIEKTLKMDGVTSAVWDEKTKMVTVTFDPAKTSIDAMQKKVAAAGHDTEAYKAPDDVYAKLPGCCHYDRVK
ncbi:MAG: heavy metal-associated domain-containing protein [Bacteroidales bacterium]